MMRPPAAVPTCWCQEGARHVGRQRHFGMQCSVLLAALLTGGPLAGAEADFNGGWLFQRGDMAGSSWAGATLDDSKWRGVETPHE